MTATRDKFGRPIVVVTGMGVITSLGAGKADNWTKLTAGESGIRTITRFPTDGLKTTIAGTVDFGVTWVSNLISANAGGMNLLEVAQIFQRSGLELVYKYSNFQ